MECGCGCVWDGIFGGDMWCSLCQFEGHNGKGRKCVLRVCHFLAREWHVPLFPSFFISRFRVLCVIPLVVFPALTRGILSTSLLVRK